MNFLHRESLEILLNRATDEVARIGEVDPYIKDTFGIVGPGEGLVFYDTTTNNPGLMFKVKTEAHAVNKIKKPKVVPVKPEGMDDFIETFFTENRFAQIAQEQLDNDFAMTNMGKFINGVMTDVVKESENEISLADFTMKDVSRYALSIVKEWFALQSNKF